MKNMLLLALLLPVSVSADYAGFSVSRAYQKLPDSAFYNPGGRDMRSTTRTNQFRLYAGTQSGIWIAEVGGGTLSSYRSRNRGPIPGRPMGCCDIAQQINTYNVDGSAGVSLPVTSGLSVFTMAGATYVYGTNHEYGENENGPNQDHRNVTRDLAPIYMAGFKYKISESVRLRLDYTAINDVAKSHWTLHSDIRSASIGLEMDF